MIAAYALRASNCFIKKEFGEELNVGWKFMTNQEEYLLIYDASFSFLVDC